MNQNQNEERSPLDTLVLMIRLARPLFLLGGVLLYALGVGIAHYLGEYVDWSVYLLGQGWVTLLQLSTQFLNEYYNAPADQDNPNRTPFTGGSGSLGPGKLPRRMALQAAFVCLAGVASFTVLLMARGVLGPIAWMIMILGFLGSFFYSTPPVSLESTGYGELTTSILVAFLVPAYGYVLQAGELHPLVALVGFPLTAIHVAMLLAFSLPDYATDQKHGKRTLIVRIGWARGMLLHNLFLLAGFFLLAMGMTMGVPTFAVLPALVALPLSILQIWLMRRIADGFPPNWTALTLNALAIFAFAAYMITYSFWTH